MAAQTIGKLLESRNAWLKGTPGNRELAVARSALTRKLSENYLDFETVRDHVLYSSDAYLRREPDVQDPLPDDLQPFAQELVDAGLIVKLPDDRLITEMEGRKYLSGGWLEELAWLAAMAAGADEAIFGQSLQWKVDNYSGENEIDLIARKGDALSFVSCKALRSELDITDRKHRNRLMDAVHEADNLTDHFGRSGEKVAVLVTTDLFDEVRNAPRYAALMGKAAALDVRIIPLEEIGWDKLVAALQGLWKSAEDNEALMRENQL